MTYHPTVDKIKSFLQSKDIPFETFEHEPVRTSEEAARIRPGYSLEQGAKALILKTKPSYKDSNFVMFVMPAHLKLDSYKGKQVLGVKEIRFATPEEVEDITSGVQVGGVPPFGNLFGIPVIVDPRLFENKRIVFNAGDRRYSIAMASLDFEKAVQFSQADIAQ